MGLFNRLSQWWRPLAFLGTNRLSLFGAALTTSSALTMLGFWFLEAVSGRAVHPYAGLVLFVALPGLFVLGLILMPLGVWWRRRQLRATGELPATYPVFERGLPAVRAALSLVGGLTLANVAILGTASYKAVEHMDSTQFCGTTCHTVMEPEYAGYRASAHARVSCAQCHIGPGASWFVRSKISGTRQLFAVAFETYSRPIHSPVKDLRPARETCEQCHWPQKFHGDKVLLSRRYGNDELNTLETNVLVLKVGGGAGRLGTGIHGRHLDDRAPITYVATDDRRQVIPVVTSVDAQGHTREYVSTDAPATPEQLAKGERRTMDCMDCHNRPSHTFELPERALDEALAEKRISVDLPFVRKQAAALLKGEYPDATAAESAIRAGLADFYRQRSPEAFAAQKPLIEAAATEVVAIYRRNVFPKMKVTWGTYPNNLGHDDFPGCFRCHDDSHKSADGRTISQDCETCHLVLDTNPKLLADLGVK